MRLFYRSLALLLVASLSLTARGETLRIVTEPWAPYVYEENGEPRGLDYDASAIVLKRLGVEVKWYFLPWKRCLTMLEQGQADGILDIFRTAEREKQMLFPAEPMSSVELVLFYAKARPHAFQRLEDLRGLKIGVSPGYWYANRAFRESTLFTREPAPTHEANFGKLLRGRIDLLITDRRAGHFLAARLGLAQLVDHHPPVIGRDLLYLGLRRNAGLESLAARFAAELRRFKNEPAYAELAARYAQPPTTAERGAR
ncbi:MAG: substrate-binding periplasmic protein [Pseudomonas sp.]